MNKEIESNVIVSVDHSPIEIGDGVLLKLSLLEGWESCTPEQQRYLTEFAKFPEGRTIAAMNLNVKISTVNQWFKQDTFSSVADQIYDLYTENLKAIDYEDSKYDPKYRARVIKARENKGSYSEKREGDKHLHLYGADTLQTLLGG